MRSGPTARRLLLLLGAQLLGLALLMSPPAQAQTSQRCFAETNQCIAGAIRAYWERHGGLPVFGYPITPLATERVEGQELPVQWFQRDRLEDHGRQGVMSGRLGARLLEVQGTPWQPRGPLDSGDGCRSFPQTGYAICEPFLSYWERNGGLERFGYPITPVGEERLGTWIGDVQYFERRRMEHHRELAGTPFEVLLGLLGQTLRDVATLDSCPTPLYEPWRAAFTRVSFRGALGCPLPVQQAVPIATQPFEGGLMVWANLGAQGRAIYVIWPRPQDSATAGPPAYRRFEDTWDERQPVDSGLTPPAGRLEPQRGFGAIWRASPEVRARLGWATAPEQPATADYQAWSAGGAFMSTPDVDDWRHSFLYLRAFAPDGAVELVRR